jgi:hypothetical protein
MKQREEGLRQVLAIDPDYVEARLALADCFLGGTTEPGYSHRSMVEALPLARAEIEKAQRLDPDSAGVHTAMSFLLSLEYDWLGAERELELAYTMNPGDGSVLASLKDVRNFARRYSEACVLERRFWALSRPDMPDIDCPLTTFWSGTLAEALTELQVWLRYARNDVEREGIKMNIAAAYLIHGRFQEAVDRFGKLNPSTLEWPYAKSGLAYCYGRLGRRDEARRILADFLAERENTAAYMMPTNIALVYEGLGERDQAFAWLERGYEEHSIFMQELIYFPIWTNLHDDPRYIALLDKMSVPPDWRRK